MIKYTCVLNDETVGVVEANIPPDEFMKEGLMALIGKTMTMKLNDENGLPIEKRGVVVSVLGEVSDD
jgi:hypothetical protein